MFRRMYLQCCQSARQCTGVQHNPDLCSAVQLSAVQLRAVQCSALQCGAVQWCAAVGLEHYVQLPVFSTIGWGSTVQYSTVFSTIGGLLQGISVAQN